MKVIRSPQSPKRRLLTGMIMGAGLAFLTVSCATKIKMQTLAVKTGWEINPKYGALINERSEFKSTDKQAVAWVEFTQARGSHTTRFQWFNPDGALVLDSGPIDVVPEAGMVYERRRTWSVLPIKDHPAELMPGKWKVDILFDNKKIDSAKLSIK